MPTESEISTYLSHIAPVLPSSLPSSSRECPLCFEPYASTTSSSPTSTLGEHPVFVLSQHPKPACRHIFGHRCIEKHFRSGGPWCTKCPVCREEWFAHNHAEWDGHWTDIDTQSGVSENNNGGPQTRERVPRMFGERAEFVRLRVPQEVRVRAASAAVNLPRSRPHGLNIAESAERAARTSDANSATRGEVREYQRMRGLRNRERVHQSIAFLQQILLTEEIDARDVDLNLKVVELERAVEKLWAKIEERGWERDLF